MASEVDVMWVVLYRVAEEGMPWLAWEEVGSSPEEARAIADRGLPTHLNEWPMETRVVKVTFTLAGEA